jgi:Peptide-N-glycosidase F, C terminal/Peptide-N-glycosidase F, N terminal
MIQAPHPIAVAFISLLLTTLVAVAQDSHKVASHVLLDAADSKSSPLLLPLVSTETPASVRLEFDLTMSPEARGVGVIFFDAPGVMPKTLPTIADFAEPTINNKANPSLRHLFAVAFDTHNPPTTDRFNADGNIYGRPQREISIHHNQRELLNLLSSEDFATGKPVRVLMGFRFVAGGVLLSMRVGETVVVDGHFFAGVEPFIPALAVGAASTDAGFAQVSDLKFTVDGQLNEPFAQAVRVDLFTNEHVTSLRQSPSEVIDLPQGEFERVVAHVRIKQPRDGPMDKWDRKAALYLVGPDAQRYELMRFVTPFGRPWEFVADITDFLPLLRERREFTLYIDTWTGGFEVDAWLDCFPGKPARTPIAVVNLWQGEQIYGDVNQPIENFLTDKIAVVPPDASAAKIRLTVTGHGQAPNTDNAAEFLPVNRTLRVNKQSFSSLLWTRDNYLNPCRPQGGTWKFDRAGWGPGRLVEPWVIDASSFLDGGRRTLDLQYTTMPYVNRNAQPAAPATLWFDGVVVFYRE